MSTDKNALFRPLRAIGHVTDDRPFSVSHRRGRSFLITPISSTFHLYDCKRLRLIRIGPIFTQRVHISVIHGSLEFVVLEGEGVIHALFCTKPLWKETHTTIGEIQFVLPIHSDEVATLASDRTFKVWQARKGHLLRSFNLSESDLKYTAAVIPLINQKNKLLLATNQGFIQLWNHKTSSLLWNHQVSTCCITSLAVTNYSPDVFAVGTKTGDIYVYHLVEGIELLHFQHRDQAAVNAISFSEAARLQVLASGTNSGEVAIWDLNDRTLICVLNRNADANLVSSAESAHVGSCVSVCFLEHEPVLVTSGTDNAIRMYVFDGANQSPRLLRSRQGHHAPCTFSTFVDDVRLLTLSSDRSVRICHALTDLYSMELSQGKLRRLAKRRMQEVDEIRAPPAIHVATCLPRKDDWASIVTVHEGQRAVRTWQLDKLRMDKQKLDTTTTQASAVATYVTTSRCGSLCFVGGSNGFVTVFYLQTGRLCHSLTDHSSAIKGIHVSSCNEKVISVSRDGTVLIHKSNDAKLLHQWKLDTGIVVTTYHADAGLLAVGADDHTIRIYDLFPVDENFSEVKTTNSSVAKSLIPVRSFKGSHQSLVTALELEPSTRRFLISAGLDAFLCVWDIVTEGLVARYSFETPVTSLSFDAQGQFLVTSHAGNRCAFVWTNMIRYGITVDERFTSKTPPLLMFPRAAVEGGSSSPTEAQGIRKRSHTASTSSDSESDYDNSVHPDDQNHNERNSTDKNDAETDMAPIVPGTHSFSDLPRSQILSLPYLDKIHEASKPILPPKKFTVPFFLPTTKDLNPTFIVSKELEKGEEDTTRVTDLNLREMDEINEDRSMKADVTLEASHVRTSKPYTSIASTKRGEQQWINLVRSSLFDDALSVLKTHTNGRIATDIECALTFTEYTASNADEELDAEALLRDRETLKSLLKFFKYHIDRRIEVDLVQALFTVFLNTYGSLMLLWKEYLKEDLMELQSSHHEAQESMQKLFDSCVGIIQNLRRYIH